MFSLNKYIAGICSRNKIWLIDCTPDFYRNGSGEEFFQSGSHLSAEGIEVCLKYWQKIALTKGGNDEIH